MSNPLVKIEHGLEIAAKDTAHFFVEAEHVAASVIKVVSDAKMLTPTFKKELATLIADVQPIATALAPAIAANGENIAADLAAVAPTLSNLRKLIGDFVSFLPVLKQAVETLEADVK